MSILSALRPETPRAPVELTVDGTVLDGFERGSLTLTMVEGANSFELEYAPVGSGTEVFGGRGVFDTLSTRPVFAGDACTLSLDAGSGYEKLLDGFVDTTEEDDAADALRLRAAGRSKTCDLVDCSLVGPRKWADSTLARIVADICKPFGIDSHVLDGAVVQSNIGGKRVTGGAIDDPLSQGQYVPKPMTFAARGDETALDAITRAAMTQGLFVYCAGGDLVLARAGTTRTQTVLERGVNIVSSRRADSQFSRFSDYMFHAQAKKGAEESGSGFQNVQASVRDAAVSRYRPLRVHVEAHDRVSAKTRATLDRNVRAGQSESISVTVDGWAMDRGVAWRPNTLVRFKNPVLGVDATMLVVTARFRFGANEPKETELQLARPEAFDLVDYPALGRGEEWT